MNALHQQQADWDAEMPPPPPPSTALLAPGVARVLPYTLLIGFAALYVGAVLADAALRFWG